MSAHDRYKNNLFNYNLNLKLKQKNVWQLFVPSIYLCSKHNTSQSVLANVSVAVLEPRESPTVESANT